MEYQALYRKYRPQRFAEVIGQDHITHTLAREVVDGRIAHAYLFAGPRGTGKTTTARLLAKSLNCTNRGADGEPDGTCASCLGIAEGNSLDVIELDAASHNKVEDVREIRVNVGTVAAAAGAHRIYILDEAHMLSRAAGNALLKTLEEPPEHVIFVLATTEPYKLLDTIRSRSQRFDFHPVASERLIDHLGDIAAREGFDVDEASRAMIAGHADGSVRDAMSLLEQVAALGNGKVRPDVIIRALGLADRDAFGRLADAVTSGDAAAALGLVAEMASRGADLRRFAAEAVEFFRGIFLAQYAPNLEEVVDESVDVIATWRRHAATIPSSEVLRTVDTLGEALLQLRQGREERLVIELALLRITRPETATDAAALATRIDRIEARLRTMERNPTPAASGASQTQSPAVARRPTPVQDTPEVQPEPADTPAQGAVSDAMPAAQPAAVANRVLSDVDLATFATVWPALVAQVREAAGPVRHALVKVATPIGAADGVVQLALPAHMPFHLERLQEDTDLQAKMNVIAGELLGGAVSLEFVGAAGVGAVADENLAEPVRSPDKDDLEPAGEAEDPAAIVVDMLGGEVVSE